MSIRDDLRAKLKDALRASDRKTADVVRMIESKVTERRTAKGFQGEVDDDLYRDVIAAYKKSLEKARAEYERGGASASEALAELDWEIAFCQQYLPAQLGDEELRAAVREAITETGADGPKMAGRVVGAVMKKHKGRVDAGRVKSIAADELG
jgi:uncharacterized protein